MLKKLLVAVALVLPMLAAAQNIKIGVVDAQTIVPNLPAYQTAMTELEAIDKKYKDEYAKFMADAQKKYEEFEALQKDSTTPQAVLERRAKELEDFQGRLQEFQKNYAEDMDKQQKAKMEPIMKQVMDAIQAVGKEGGYTLIQDAAAVLYYGGAAENITQQVKTRLGLK